MISFFNYASFIVCVVVYTEILMLYAAFLVHNCCGILYLDWITSSFLMLHKLPYNYPGIIWHSDKENIVFMHNTCIIISGPAVC